MRIVVSALLLAGLAFGRPAFADMRSPACEAGLALGAAVSNVVYMPAKAAVAAVGLAAGTFAGLLTGGDTRAAYALWVPTAGGTWGLTPDHLDGTRPIEFFGSDYADRPSRRMNTVGTPYDAVYRSR